MSKHCDKNSCSGGNDFYGGHDPVIRVPERDHNLLHNRDEANQHPIKAITNLRTRLNEKANKSDIEPLSNTEINEILGGL